ncbi:MAG: hypothetical protein U0269_31580 [Polyangiales bacterium]
MTELALEWKVDGVEAWTLDDVLILWQRGVYSMAAVEANDRTAKAFTKRPGGFRVVLLVEPEAPQPDEPARKQLMKADTTGRRAFAIVTLSTGFRAALVSSVASAIAMTMTARSRSPVKAFNDAKSAAEWIGTFATPNDAERIARALDAMRAGLAR